MVDEYCIVDCRYPYEYEGIYHKLLPLPLPLPQTALTFRTRTIDHCVTPSASMRFTQKQTI
jgi:hypothetical protein